MADSHIPNSQATPGWKDYSFPRTQFIDAAQTKVVDGNPERYSGTVPIDWCAGAGSRGNLPAFGGLLCAAIVNAACQFSRAQFQDRAKHQPLSLNVEFLGIVPQGCYCINLSILHSSASTATIQADIVPAESKKTIVYCRAIVRVGSLKRKGLSDEEVYTQQAFVVPDRIRDCNRSSDAFYYHINPPSSATRCYTPHGGPSPLWSPRFGGRNVRYMWHKLDNGKMFETEHLLLLADLIPPIPLNYEEDALQGVLKYQMPTISLQIKFCEEIQGDEWLLTKTKLRWLSGARFDESIDIINDRGQIVATCHQLIARLPSKMFKEAGKSRGRL